MAEAQTRGRAEVEGILSQDNANPRAAVHSFDPDASPEEKAAQAGKPAPALKSVKERADNTTGLFNATTVDVAFTCSLRL